MYTQHSTPWHHLPLTNPIRSSPPLLIRTQFAASSYTIYITDLTRIWSESLSKQDILSRAAQDDTSIDPSEDSDQLRILLQKLDLGLQSLSDGGAVELSSIAQDDGSCQLKLTTRQELPPPLPELKWTFSLSQGSGVDFTNIFVAPLLSLASLHADEIESLITTIAEKDRIIGKLVDQLEDTKVDIKTVIGGGRARRKGLEKFDEKHWREDIEDLEENRPIKDLVRDVFEKRKLVEFGSVKKIPESSTEWWKAVEDEDAYVQVASPKAKVQEKVPEKRIASLPAKEDKISYKLPSPSTSKGKGKEPAYAAAASETEGDDDFVVQSTPPPQDRKEALKRATTSPTKSSTPPPPPVAHLSPPAKPISSIASPEQILRPKFATIGGKKQEPAAQPVQSPKKPIGKDTDEETEDDDDDLDGIAHLPPSSKVKTVIGGRAKPSPVPKASISSNSATVRATAPAVRKTIGTIGGKKPKSDPSAGNETMDVDEPKSPGVKEKKPTRSLAAAPSPKKKSPMPELEEDEDERADRKRRQLEQELEAKKKAPVKKKRKF